MNMNEEFEKWWHGFAVDDTSRHPANRYEGAMGWAYEGWVRGVAAEREACAKVCDEVFEESNNYRTQGYASHCAAAIRARR